MLRSQLIREYQLIVSRILEGKVIIKALILFDKEGEGYADPGPSRRRLGYSKYIREREEEEKAEQDRRGESGRERRRAAGEVNLDLRVHISGWRLGTGHTRIVNYGTPPWGQEWERGGGGEGETVKRGEAIGTG